MVMPVKILDHPQQGGEGVTTMIPVVKVYLSFVYHWEGPSIKKRPSLGEEGVVKS
jgi:hypothetical protein